MTKRRKIAWPSPHINGVMGVYCILSAGIAIYRFEIDSIMWACLFIGLANMLLAADLVAAPALQRPNNTSDRR
jgi:hypothetical protein